MSQLRRRMMMARGHDSGAPVGNYIEFADPVVKAICVANWGNDGELTYEQAAAVTSIGTQFRYKADVTSFDEFQYFTNCKTIGAYGFNGTKLTSIKIPTSIESIGQGGFANISTVVIETLNLPNLKTIGSQAFRNLQIGRIESLGNITILSEQAFAYIKLCKSIVIPNSVTTIQSYAIADCSLEHIDIGSGVTTIGGFFMYNNRKLSTLIIRAITPPTLNSQYPFNNVPTTAKIYVPDESLDAYKTASVWSQRASQIYPLSTYTESL